MYVLYKVYRSVCTYQRVKSHIFVVCHEAYHGGLLWRTQSTNQMAHLRCSDYHPSFQSGVYIGRMCNFNAEWEAVDFSNCTMDLDATPFIAVEVQQTASNVTVPTDVLDTVASQVCWSNPNTWAF